MESTVERELKLEPPDGFELPPLDGENLESRVFTSTYYDTPPRSLLRAGITLRRRVENGLSRWQLKLPRDGYARAEIEAFGGPVGPPEDLRQAADRASAPRRDRAGRDAAYASRRRPRRRRRAGARRRDARCRRRPRRRQGDRAFRGDRGRARRRRRGRPEAARPHPAPRRSEAICGHAEADAGARRRRGGGARTTMRRRSSACAACSLEQLVEIEAHDPGVRLGDHAEDVHKARVATRRARALIRATRPLLGETLGPARGRAEVARRSARLASGISTSCSSICGRRWQRLGRRPRGGRGDRGRAGGGARSRPGRAARRPRLGAVHSGSSTTSRRRSPPCRSSTCPAG